MTARRDTYLCPRSLTINADNSNIWGVLIFYTSYCSKQMSEYREAKGLFNGSASSWLLI